MIRIMLQSAVFAVVLASCLPPTLWAATLVVPGANSSTEGTSNNGYPFSVGNFDQTSQRYQQVYSSLAFAGSPILISGIDFRPDVNGEPFSKTLSSVRIDL